ncbi:MULTISPECIES: 16S rRNA (cytosine(967)-C(5))-methyltransferase RsmB [unclassified Undibacterium]|uniref:16S rRNA (cytosine(967)-C(5))-methyltransferase RsmB n=2 Tax=Pseudomonadota TaxID=1224 RepID=UPI002AC91D9B|nr:MULTISPECIES: 16S rRNA (cytosine(967)-C(5))-methyltransferase RsmB [unclassified Undibacterium]MEB0140794.1 16S rRNA (cytosine(967)-C(5))-methyltransferase RsmB [Undibacterium sp. CCC2.1]MEB0173768.1 16S rRNA (cytosine(967)-C(5))-methyltransferase RsmB [Undibacterium sp. CCC1.1]MEB0177755.1 16S rRNA (cytosine(967)-C(5))-methyltransferase RsmB [Undibacterium sp. CCC3.4]MEB0216955.1 16S rRNA (cytosine(967)-C(5))-methyltransferase RsmB [Undibacterium sp. 5I2]WPX44679.1 16S rRNA (cytosine(967)-
MTKPALRPAVIEAPLSELKTDSLAFSLSGAAQAVASVLEGMALPQALAKVFAQTQATPQARGAIQDISYRTMRQVGRVDALLKSMTNKEPEPAMLYSLLCCSLTLLVNAEDGTAAPYEDFVVVDQAVTAATASPHMVFAKGMVNAVLRRFLREKDELLKLVMKQPAALWNYPQWWVDQTKTAYPSDWQAILTTANHAPPLTLRVNQRRSNCGAYLAMLDQEQIAASQIGPNAIRLGKALPVAQIPGFADGLVSVQDAAAQLAGPLLDLADGMRVLDACAAPGGKTCHLLELADIELLALDIDSLRLAKIEDNLLRLQLSCAVKAGDASRSTWWDQRLFERIIADVPCTASGVVRRHPDSRWLRRKTDTAQLAALSSRILDNLWRMLAPGGKMLMVTCSIWPQESELQAAAFVQKHSAIRLPAPGQLLPTLADSSSANNEHDGLFYALFQKPL